MANHNEQYSPKNNIKILNLKDSIEESEEALIEKVATLFGKCWVLTTRQPLWFILCRLPEKGRRETEEIVEEMKERDWGESGK